MTQTTIKQEKQNEKIDNKNRSDDACVWPQILAILVGSLAGFIDGVLFAWTSPFIVKLVQDKENYDITEIQASKFTIIQPAVIVITCPFLFNISDKIGRKKTLLFLSIPQTISLLLTAFAKDIYVFYAARCFTGFASAFLWCSLPMYIGEVASPEVRGVWGNAITSSIYTGQFLVNIVGSYFDVAVTSYIFLPIPILFFICFTFMPESPYYYLMKQNGEGARRSLRFLTRKQNVDDEFEKLQADVARQMSESGSWKDLILIESNLKAMCAAFFLRFSQQFCGTAILSQYTQFIMEKAGGAVSPQITSILYSGLGVVLNFLVIAFIVDRFKRKHLYASSILLCSLTLFVLGAYFYIDEFVPEIDSTPLNWIPITSIIFYQFSFSFGAGVIPTLMLGELFSASVKAKAMMILLFLFGVTTFFANYIFNILTSNVGSYAPFVFFSSVTFVMSILALWLIPDTKGKTLEEIQMAFKHKK